MKPDHGPARPFLKWAGGKTQVIDELWCNLPRSFNRYYEPFLGGGALFFLMWNNREKLPLKTQVKGKRFVISDKNSDLMRVYKAVRDHPEELIEELARYQLKVTKADYLRVRKGSKSIEDLKGCARFIYLNKTCYNGLYRVNRYGKFNVPWGGREQVRIYNEDTIRTASKALKGSIIHDGDYTLTVKSASRGDLVYLDPPYLTDGFCHYTSDGFDREEHIRLAEFAVGLSQKGVMILHSNAEDSLIRELYPENVFSHIVVQSKRMINSDGKGRGPVDELIVRNYADEAVIGPVYEQQTFRG